MQLFSLLFLKKLTLLLWGILGLLLVVISFTNASPRLFLIECPLIGNLVSMNQSAFIPSRSISENVLLAQEIVRNYHKDKGKPRCTLKIDLMKAYDSVNWEFLIYCLHCFGFPKKFVSWIKECVTSSRFSVCLNGSLVGYFEGKKGLRQGDPLSPYLFVLAMEVLSRILVATTGPGSGFNYNSNCLKMKLTHLCFADDLLIFSKVSQNSIGIIKAALVEFEELSGLKANPSKSFFFCSGISDRLKHLLLQDLQMQEGKFPVRYLGVPLISSALGFLIGLNSCWCRICRCRRVNSP
jgi:hypothetical protein